MNLASFADFSLQEMINSPDQLRSADVLYKKGAPVDPALLTHKEYLRLVDGDKHHEASSYQTTVADLSRYCSIEVDNTNRYAEYEPDTMKLVQRLKVGTLDIELYSRTRKLTYTKWLDDKMYASRRYTDEEMKELGLQPYNTDLELYHDRKCIGRAGDEWGATLVMVAQEYRGMGLGEILIHRYRKSNPDRSSGGFTLSGRRNFKKVHLAMVKEYMRNGIYSALVKKGELTKERVKEIIASVGYHEQPAKQPMPDIAKYFNNLPENLRLIRYADSDFVLFDASLQHIHGTEAAEFYVDRKIIAFVSLHWREDIEHYILRHCFADSPDNLSLILRAALSSMALVDNAGLVLRKLSPEVDAFMKAEISKGNAEVIEASERGGYPVKVTKTTKPKDLEPLYRAMDQWFKVNDPYHEFIESIISMAYSKADELRKAKDRAEQIEKYGVAEHVVKTKLPTFVAEAAEPALEEPEAKEALEVKAGDLVDFGEYGHLYVCNPKYSDGFYWATEEESDRYNGEASGWALRKSAAEQVLEPGADSEDDYDPSDDI